MQTDYSKGLQSANSLLNTDIFVLIFLPTIFVSITNIDNLISCVTVSVSYFQTL